MFRRVAVVVAVLTIASVASSLAAPGQGGPPGAEPCTVIQTLPAVITQPGRYCLDRPLTIALPANGVAIDINANDVVLDLRGFSVTNSAPDISASFSYGIHTSKRFVTVRNGTISRFMYGVFLEGQPEAAVVEDLRVADATYEAIRVEGRGSLIRRNHVFNTNGSQNPYRTTQNVTFASGISAYGSNHRILDNDVEEIYSPSDAHGIWMNACNACLVERNRVANEQSSTNTEGIGGGWSERTLVVGNRIVNMAVGISAYTANGILYRDNVTFACTTPYGQGIDGGNNR